MWKLPACIGGIIQHLNLADKHPLGVLALFISVQLHILAAYSEYRYALYQQITSFSDRSIPHRGQDCAVDPTVHYVVHLSG